MLNIGIDIGSTTAKMVASDDKGNIYHTVYVRHGARIREILAEFFDTLQKKAGDTEVSVCELSRCIHDDRHRRGGCQGGLLRSGQCD